MSHGTVKPRHNVPSALSQDTTCRPPRNEVKYSHHPILQNNSIGICKQNFCTFVAKFDFKPLTVLLHEFKKTFEVRA